MSGAKDEINLSTLSSVARASLLQSIETITQRLKEYQVLKGREVQITETEIGHICVFVIEAFQEEPVCLDIDLTKPINVIGDIFGQYGDLLRIFNILGHPPHTRYLFLGNYVDRGRRSIETLTLLYCYKILFPKSIFLLRGNHECRVITEHFGFADECTQRLSARLWCTIVGTFEYMPIVAIIDDDIFCTHSGLSPALNNSVLSSKNELRDYLNQMITRPTEVHTNPLVTHFLWSEADPEVSYWEQNPSGLGYLYGSKVVSAFCERFGFRQIIRSNEVNMQGYEFFTDPRLITIFTAPNFARRFPNSGALVNLQKKNLLGLIKAQLKQVVPLMKRREKNTGMMTITIVDASSKDINEATNNHV